MPSGIAERREAATEIAAKARFEAIRYAQLWEDADCLLLGLAEGRKSLSGSTLVSICSAGDNALAMLTLDPARVVAVDLSAAQIECLKIRIAAYRALDHAALLELMGSRPSNRRAALLERVAADLPETSQGFWAPLKKDVEAYGLGGIGRFERYFRIFHAHVLPLVHGRATVDAVFQPRSREERRRFLDERWNSWRWRILLKLFFSRFTMGRLGRDPAFFDHVEGSVADHVARRVVQAIVETDPTENPYLHWVLKGTHGEALPLALRPEHFETIRDRLDRLDIRHGALEAFVATGEKADGFNLSDIFEYMGEETFRSVYESLVGAANPGARLVYWNMMVPRRMPADFAARVKTVEDVEARGRAMDKAFFYSDFVVEEAR
jgi:S-adenosylmethionine-diacylglycerol 3-amino-3-carboxypropyl transferase